MAGETEELIMGDLEGSMTKEERTFSIRRNAWKNNATSAQPPYPYQLPEASSGFDSSGAKRVESKLEELQQSMNQMVSELDKQSENIALIQQS